MNNASSVFVKNGSNFSVAASADLNVHDTLPVGVYVVMFNPDRGFYLAESTAMVLPKKVYGSVPSYTERIFNTYLKRGQNTGVLLGGEKGAGKTLTLGMLTHKCLAENMPVIIINSQFVGDAFNKFLSSITQPCMVAFDEFDKVYDPKYQELILTLLDGVFSSHKLFVITCNDVHKLSQFLINRPGRIFYNIKYSKMEEEAVRQYCADRLDNKKETEGVVSLLNLVSGFNFDMLQAVIEEMNRYKESAKDAVKLLNIHVNGAQATWTLVISKGDKVVHTQNAFTIDPLRPFMVNYTDEEIAVRNDARREGEAWEDDYVSVSLTHKDIKKMSGSGYVFEKDNHTIRLEREKSKEFSYYDYL